MLVITSHLDFRGMKCLRAKKFYWVLEFLAMKFFELKSQGGSCPPPCWQSPWLRALLNSLCNLFWSTQPNDQETLIELRVKWGGSLLKDLESCKGILQLGCKNPGKYQKIWYLNCVFQCCKISLFIHSRHYCRQRKVTSPVTEIWGRRKVVSSQIKLQNTVKIAKNGKTNNFWSHAILFGTYLVQSLTFEQDSSVSGK